MAADPEILASLEAIRAEVMTGNGHLAALVTQAAASDVKLQNIVDLLSPASETPEWVPNCAAIHLDFLGNRAWDGTGEVAPDALVGNDPDADVNYAETTGYSADYLTSDGYLGAPMAMPFIGAAKSALLAGAVIRLKYLHVISQASLFYVSNAAGTSLFDFDHQEDASMDVFGNDFEETVQGVFNNSAVNVVAALVQPGGPVRIAVNGSVIGEWPLSENDWPASGPNVPTFALTDPKSSVALQEVTIYATSKAAELAALSVA